MAPNTITQPHVSRPPYSQSRLPDGRKRAKILIADDDPFVRSLLYDVLSGAGYDVDTAADGGQGLLLFELARQDLVILDLVMPRLTGWQLAEHVCEIDTRVPIIALTGFGANLEEEAERRGILLVHKPVDLGALLDVVRGLLPREEEIQH